MTRVIPEHPLRRFRKERKMTLRDLAALTGASRFTISRIETRKQNPDWDFVAAVKKLSEGALTAEDFLPLEAAE